MSSESLEEQEVNAEKFDKAVLIEEVIATLKRRRDEDLLNYDERTYTGEFLLDKSASLRDALQRAGLKIQDRCAYATSDDVSAIITTTAILRSGGVLVGLPTFTAAELWMHFINDCDPAMIVCEEYQSERVRELLASSESALNLPIVVIDNEGNVISFPDQGIEPMGDVRLDPEVDVSFRYTSGSTDNPKGVLLPNRHATTLFYTFDWMFGRWENGRYLSLVPPTDYVGFMMLYSAFRRDELAIMYRGKPSPEGILGAIEENNITDMFNPTAQMVQMAESPAVDFVDYSSLKRIAYAGQVFPPQTLANAQENLDCELLQAYGGTEMGMLTLLSPEDHRSGDLAILASAGRPVPIPGLVIELHDPETGKPVPQGEIGHVCVKSPGLFREVWNRPDLSKNDAEWWDTKDLGIFDTEGRLTIKGRDRDIIFYRGFTIYCRDVENCITDFNNVREAAVHPVNDEFDGEHVFAWVVLEEPEGGLDTLELSKHVEKELGKWFRPSHIEVIESMPVKSNLAKTDKTLLREKAEALITKEFTA